MAEVYAGTHTNGLRVALKILRSEHLEDASLRARFLADTEYARRVRHPDRLEAIGVTRTDDGAPTIVLELLEGETLASLWTRRGSVSLRRALWIGERLLDFLDACHAAGVAHRDLKPENVFLTLDNRVKVLDFGVARGGADAHAEVFGVGAILWSIVSGRGPRQGNSPTLAIAGREQVVSLAVVAPDAPKEVAAIVDRALEHDPTKRWPNVRSMQTEIQKVLACVDLGPMFDLPMASSLKPTHPDTPSSIWSRSPSR